MGESLEDIFQQEDIDDLKTIEFIRNYISADVKEKFDDELIQYFLDVIWEYYAETFGDTDAEVEIDTEAVAAYVVKTAKKEKMGEFELEDVQQVVLGELEYAETLEDED